MKNKLIFVFSLFVSSIVFSQEKSDAFSSEQTKYQIGIGVSKFISNIFPSDENSFLIEGRVLKNNKVNYRLGIDYNVNTSEDGNYRGGIKLGIDRMFKQSNKWQFYYGFDFGYTHSYLKSSEKHIGGVLLSPFLGIMYKFSKNFSMSTEPNIHMVQKILIDDGTFENNNKKYWVESGFGKIGFVQLNFHF